MLIEITTNGCVAEPVLWQTSTFWPAVFCLVDEVFSCVGCADECVWLECVELTWLELETWLELACECPFAFAGRECFVWPGALAEFPCAACEDC